jgi:hypothetical protein
MNELALFAGNGGGILGGKLLGWRTVPIGEATPSLRSSSQLNSQPADLRV